MKPEFSAAQAPLEKGFTVIEASAGTGKTTTISAIVLRLLVEQEIPIEHQSSPGAMPLRPDAGKVCAAFPISRRHLALPVRSGV